MTTLFSWQILLLICPSILSIALFCFMLWNDKRHDRKKKIKRLNNN